MATSPDLTSKRIPSKVVYQEGSSIHSDLGWWILVLFYLDLPPPKLTNGNGKPTMNEDVSPTGIEIGDFPLSC